MGFITPSIWIAILAFYWISAGFTNRICNVSLVALKLQVRVLFKFRDTLVHFKPLELIIALYWLVGASGLSFGNFNYTAEPIERLVPNVKLKITDVVCISTLVAPEFRAIVVLLKMFG